VSFIPPSCPGSEASGIGGPDVEDHIFCDVDEDGEIIAYVLVSRTYDSAGNPGPPQFFDPFTSAPYVVQGTLAQCCCEAVSGGSGPSRFLNCETDSITICVDAPIPVTGDFGFDGPISVTGVVDIRLLNCSTDSVTICATDPIPVSISGGSFGPLTCETDSVTVCQGTTPWIVHFDNESLSVSGTFTQAPLNCETDSITICTTEPIPVSGVGPFDIRLLDCVTDSITVCPPDDDSPFHVIVDSAPPVSGVFVSAPLSCETDSVTVCAPASGFHVIVDSSPPVSGAPLSCETDSVTVCQGTDPWVVNEPDLPDFTGTWGYNAGVGTSVLVLSGSKRLIQISVIAGTSTAATFNVNGGDTITVPTNATFTFTPAVQLIDPTVSFTDPAAWVVEWLS
jgi:hypothetical protein